MILRPGYVVFTTDHFSDWVLDLEDVPSARSLAIVLFAVIVALVKRFE